MNLQACQPTIGISVRCLRLKTDIAFILKCIPVVLKDLPAFLHAVIDDLELSPANACTDIAEAIVITNSGVLVMGCIVARVGGKEFRFGCPLRVVGKERATAGCRDDLVAVEREYSYVTIRAELL